MALKIRLQRHGTSHRPFYRMVVTEANARRDGRFVEVLGTYEPQASRVEDEINLKLDRIDYWKSVGAKATDTAASLIRRVNRDSNAVNASSGKATKATDKAVAKEELEASVAEVEAVPAESQEAPACTLKEAEESEVVQEESAPATEEETSES